MADAITPGPHDAPALHDAIGLGPFTWPPDAAYGAVKVKAGAEVEQQKPNGKARARAKVKGKKILKF